MKTFSITTLGCRVNHYESEQLAVLLRGRGLVEAPSDQADLRIVHTCSVTIQAAGKSRQAVRRGTRLTQLPAVPTGKSSSACPGETSPTAADRALTELSLSGQSSVNQRSIPALSLPIQPYDGARPRVSKPKVIVTGCWATSNADEAAQLPGVDAVLGHHQDVGKELARLLNQWLPEEAASGPPSDLNSGVQYPAINAGSTSPKPVFDDGWMMQKAGTRAGKITNANQPYSSKIVNDKLDFDENSCEEKYEPASRRPGMVSLPQLNSRQTGHQRAFLKIQDGCDAHCTYCIIPRLRPRLWSKTVDEAVEEATRLVDAGHIELVLTGIFLGAYGQPTALRRRQPVPTARPLGHLIEALCTRVPGLGRLRLSSLEPGDLNDELIALLGRHHQVVPHFHLPLQSGSNRLLRRMNRQYDRDDYLRMARQIQAAFDRPAITTDILVGFPGETDAEFDQTLDLVSRVGFIHIHAFPFSPRPKTAAARWSKDFIRGPIVQQRINRLVDLASQFSLAFRKQFIGQTVEILAERAGEGGCDAGFQHGRCERYFPVHFEDASLPPGARASVRIDRVTPGRTFGILREAF